MTAPAIDAPDRGTVATEAEGISLRADARRWWTLSVLCVSLVLILIDNTVLNVALPTLARDLAASGSDLQWIVDGYGLVFAGFLLTAGSLGDTFGRRRMLAAGLVTFAVGSVAAAFAHGPTELIASRALMGVGGACIMPATLSILTDVFRDPRERAKAIAIWAACSGLGVALGPVTGGWLLEHFWWGSVFLVNLPVLALALLGTATLVPRSRDPHAPPIDVGGAVLSIAGLGALLYAIIEAPSRGWTSGTTLGWFAIATAVLAAFGWWEARRADPMLDLGFFRNPRFSAASGSVALTFFALFGSLFVVTQYMQFVMGYTAFQAGVRYLPLAVMMGLAGSQSARSAERFGTKWTVATGLGLISVGLLCMLRLGLATGYGPLLLCQLVLAAGLGLTMGPATESIMGSLPVAKAGIGSAMNDATREVGGALGVAVLGSILSSTFAARMSTVLAGDPLPVELAGTARESIGGSIAVADHLGGAVGDTFALAARSAFVDGLHVTSLVAAGFALTGALIAAALLPARASEETTHD